MVQPVRACQAIRKRSPKLRAELNISLLFCSPLSGESMQSPRIFRNTSPLSTAAALLWVGSSITILMALKRGYEGSWYPLSTIIHHPEAAEPPFGYRPLLPLLAAWLQHVFHSMSDHNVFIATQTLSIAGTVYLLGKWTSLYLPTFGRPVGYMLAAIMLAPNIGYLTFYDIALTGFWTACLILLHDNKPIAYLIVFTLATFNHENILLLVPCAILYYWRRMSPGRLAAFALAQIVAWSSARYLVVSLIPAITPALFENNLALNLTFWKSYPKGALLFTALRLVPWWALAAMGWNFAPRLLRCAAITLPGLFLVTFLFGRFDEPRQFDAFIPVCIGFIACWATKMSGTSSSPLRPAEPVHAATTDAGTSMWVPR